MKDPKDKPHIKKTVEATTVSEHNRKMGCHFKKKVMGKGGGSLWNR